MKKRLLTIALLGAMAVGVDALGAERGLGVLPDGFPNPLLYFILNPINRVVASRWFKENNITIPEFPKPVLPEQREEGCESEDVESHCVASDETQDVVPGPGDNASEVSSSQDDSAAAVAFDHADPPEAPVDAFDTDSVVYASSVSPEVSCDYFAEYCGKIVIPFVNVGWYNVEDSSTKRSFLLDLICVSGAAAASSVE